MASLTAQQKRFVVTELAVFETPSQVVVSLQSEHGVETDRMQVSNYDGSKPWARRRMAKALVELFDETRAAFRERTDDIAIANKAYRLRRLDKLAREAKSPKLEAELMEQAAKECGDSYTNRRELTGKDGGPIATEGAVQVYLPDNGRG